MEALINAIPRDDYESIRKALLEQKKDSKNPFMHAFGDINAAMENIQDFWQRGQIVMFYNDKDKRNLVGILIYDVVQFWWSREYFLSEVLVLNTDKSFHGFGRIAIEKMKELAGLYKCAGICSGCILEKNAPMVANMYKKAGFQIATSNFVKDLRHEV